MLVDIVRVVAFEPYRLHLEFADGLEGDVDIAGVVRLDGVFEVLKAPEVFAAVRVDPELGTIVWPNGADLDPAVLHDALRRGRPTEP